MHCCAAQPGISLGDVAKAIGISDVLVAIRQNFPGELAKHGISEAQKMADNGRAMQFCAERVARQLWQQTGIHSGDSPNDNMRCAAVGIAAATEYICAEILEIAGNCARDHQSEEITPRDIHLAVFSDEELGIQFADCGMFGASVSPVR